MGVFEQIMAGLQDSLAYSKGELDLVTSALPAPPPPISPAEIHRIREKSQMSQTVFSATLNVSPRTVKNWEQGTRKPSDSNLRLLQIMATDPAALQRIAAQSNNSSTTR